MKKNVKFLYIMTFIIVMCIPHLLFLVCKNFVDTNNYENREFYSAPIVGETPYTEFASKFESYYNDRLPFRNQLISLINNIGYFVFKDTTGDQVMIGKDDWLFIEDPLQGNAKANYLGDGMLSDEELKAIADNLVANEKVLNENGMEFVIFVSPNKSRVYPEYMPDYMGEPAKEYQFKQILEYLKANTDLRIVYDYEDIMAGKEALKGQLKLNMSAGIANDDIHVYNKVDTHWNNVGAYIGTASLLKELGVNVPDISELTIKPIPNETSDLGGMLHMKNYFIDKEMNYDVSGYDTNDVKELEFDEKDVFSYTSSAPDDRSVYILRDSFGTAMAPYMGANFKNVYFKHQSYYSWDNLMEVNPDVFVFETVERAASYTFLKLNVLDNGSSK